VAFVKLVVTGPFSAGKTTFVQTVNEIRGVSTEVGTLSDRHVKSKTTVAMDFGRVTLADGRQLHLFGTPGQRRFAFMWETLIVECNGILMLVDSGNPNSLAEAAEMFDFFAARSDGVPMFVVANKQDAPGALPPEEIARRLNLVTPGQSGRVVVLPPPGCVGSDRGSVEKVLTAIAPHLAERPLDEGI